MKVNLERVQFVRPTAHTTFPQPECKNVFVSLRTNPTERNPVQQQFNLTA